MTQQKPVYLHFFWHQHQPWYVIPGSNRSIMPWVRLHGVKDYYDIAWLSQEFEGWKQTINLVPSLLVQIQRYVDGSLTDESWELSRKPASHLSLDEKKQILERFFDAHAPRMIHPYPRYDELFRKRGRSLDKAAERFSEQDLRDLQVWHNLSWIDPIWREDPHRPLRALLRKQRDFTEDDKAKVLDLHQEILAKIIPIHRELSQAGKICLTCSPFYHPILPLLCNTSIAKISNPRDPVPDPPFVSPEDAQWQIQEGIAAFERILGSRPVGMWPSEGSVSDPVCALLAKEKIPFFATDEKILFNSSFIHGNAQDRNQLYRLHRLNTPEGEIDCVFRDHGLSDLIGFIYQSWNAKDAARDFISHLKTIGTSWSGNIPPLVSVIMDGENCWEFYPRDGHDFLRYLIEGILSDPQIIPTTVPEFRQEYPTTESTLRSIHPGSWINANYRIWIGHQENNSGWHFLRQAREKLVKKEPFLKETARKSAWEMLHIAEGSDWFWWFGDINSCAHDLLFDQLFRRHLIHLYELIDEPVPEALKRSIKQSKKIKKGGGILFRQPALDNRCRGYYEWVGSNSISVATGGGAMHQAKEELEATIRYGRLNKELSLFVQFKQETSLKGKCRMTVQITKPIWKSIPIPIFEGGNQSPELQKSEKSSEGFEMIVDLQAAGIEPHQEIWFFLEFEPEGDAPFILPHGSEIYLQGYNAANASLYWFL